MNKLAKPNINFQLFFATCIAKKESDLRSNLLERFPKIADAASAYDEHAHTAQTHLLARIPKADIAPLTDTDLIKIYKNQMAKNNGPGRNLYDMLLKAAKGVCPFCNHGVPRTLDHYLPKDNFPEFSIFPLNLVPSCRDCNSAKSIFVAQSQNELYLHPYYDDISGLHWLHGEVSFIVDGSPTILFSVKENLRTSNGILYDRIVRQMEVLSLQEVYSIQAGNELSGILNRLRELFDIGGQLEVTNYLKSLATSKKAVNINSWQAAMYDAIANDVRFCQMLWEI